MLAPAPTLVHVRRRLAAAAVAILAITALASASPRTDARGPSVSLILRTGAATDSVAREVARLDGTVTHRLPIVDGMAVRVPASAVDDVVRARGVLAATLDGRMRVLGTGSGDDVRSVYPKVVRATEMWKAGYDGSGVTVALVDTGIAPVPDVAGRVLTVTDEVSGQQSPCLNLSGEPDCADSFGHGTFMAGIIAGDGAASGGAWKGTAPGARLVSIKVAGRDGAADVSNVLAAIQWTVSYRDRYGIRVLNLSLGTDGTQTYRSDPLNYAVERAWDSGLVVVVAAGNRGPGAATISKPGDDPLVVTVGAVDDRGTPGVGNDTVPNFSSRGPTAADGLSKPDVVAPGAHMVSLRAPGSALDAAFPTVIDEWYRRGSGTSMATAVVSGTAALVLQAQPTAVPDRVKYALTSTARGAGSTDPTIVGKGVVDAYAAAFAAPAGTANADVVRSTGLGSLDASRGTLSVRTNDPAGVVIAGSQTAQLLVWDAGPYVAGEWTAASWHAASWHAASWHAASWHGSSFYGTESPDSYGQGLTAGAIYGAWE